MRERVSWLLMFFIGIIIIIIGFEGALGKVVGSVVTPGEIIKNNVDER